ncbi:MAG: hypothetical protein AMXMBFR16_10390 [Candidatus Uhrbacteria bacterium]
MSLLFMEGFETVGTVNDVCSANIITGLTSRWDAVHTNSPGNSTVKLVGGQRRGTALQFTGGVVELNKQFGSNQQTWIVGFGFRRDGDPPYGHSQILQVVEYNTRGGGGEQISLYIGGSGAESGANSGKIMVYYAGTRYTTNMPSTTANTWYYIEVKTTIVNANTGTVEVRLNGVTAINAVNIDTSRTGNNYARGIVLCSHTLPWTCDNLYICDGTGATNNNFLGQVSVEVHRPNGDGATQEWTPSANVSHVTLVDNTVPINFSDYVETDTVNQTELFTNNTWDMTTNIYGIQISADVRATGSEAKKVQMVVEHTGNEVTANTYFATGPNSQVQALGIAETVPGTSNAWTNSDLSAAQFGFRKAAL